MIPSVSIPTGKTETKARVLIVDDNRVNLHLLTALLERTGQFSIDTAIDGENALKAMEQTAPDLILLDLMMPKLDGFEFCQIVRANPDFADLPVLVQSSLNRSEDRAKAFAAGATDYITKPINMKEMMARIRIHLENRSLVRDLQGYRARAENELRLARCMQERLLPAPRQDHRLDAMGIEFDALFVPTSELGGDLWGCRPLKGNRLLLYIVDFSGHGVGAALNTFRLHAIIQGMDTDGEPGEILAAINKRLSALLPTGQFATMLLAVLDLDSDICRYASAGSTAPVFWQGKDKQGHLEDSAGLPLGILPEVAYSTHIQPLPSGSRLFLYSDGAIEIPVGNGVNGEEAFLVLVDEMLVRDTRPGGLERVAQALTSIGPIEDDLTFVLLHRR